MSVPDFAQLDVDLAAGLAAQLEPGLVDEVGLLLRGGAVGGGGGGGRGLVVAVADGDAGAGRGDDDADLLLHGELYAHAG